MNGEPHLGRSDPRDRILRLSQAGDKNIGRGSLPEIVAAVVLMALPQGVVAAWLVLGWDELDAIARLMLTAELVAAASTGLAVWLWARRYR